MAKRFPFPCMPAGWYVVGHSHEVGRGKLVTRRYFEQELVIFRAESGEVRVADAFCPHMGAHLGRVGEVTSTGLRCRFHGFQYDGQGKCVATSYEGPAPARARLKFWDTREQNGLILVWYDPLDRPAEWEVPALDDEGWGKTRFKRYRIKTTPQETTENSVDFGHFTQIHAFTGGSIQRPVEVDGPLLTINYRALRPEGVPGLPKWNVPVEYDVNVWGLGYSQVNIRIPALGMRLRAFVLPIPLDEETIDLRIGMASVKAGPLTPIIRYFSHRILCWEVDQDLDVWTYKAYLENPALAKGDGPVGTYRRYVKQFYVDPEDLDAHRAARGRREAPAAVRAVS